MNLLAYKSKAKLTLPTELLLDVDEGYCSRSSPLWFLLGSVFPPPCHVYHLHKNGNAFRVGSGWGGKVVENSPKTNKTHYG